MPLFAAAAGTLAAGGTRGAPALAGHIILPGIIITVDGFSFRPFSVYRTLSCVFRMFRNMESTASRSEWLLRESYTGVFTYSTARGACVVLYMRNRSTYAPAISRCARRAPSLHSSCRRFF